MINHISESSKMAYRKYKTRHDYVGEVIRWVLYKKFKFYHITKGYMREK